MDAEHWKIQEQIMTTNIIGVHHVTAIASDPQRNVDFYTGVLGLRLVKLTVNFDDPSAYHLYYGDWRGAPGTIMTFFSWPAGRRGRYGTGQIGEVAFTIPRSSLAHWTGRLIRYGVQYTGPTRRFDEQILSFRDPDGLLIELVASAEADGQPGWEGGSAPAEHAVRGLHNVTLWEDEHEQTAQLLTNTLGFTPVGADDTYARYAVGAGGPGALVQVRTVTGFWQGATGVGTVHHVAWRTPDDEQQQQWHDTLDQAGVNVTPVRDRQYFRSIYFREPGGVLFEIATDPPGFAIDEPVEQLGTQLKLPPWLEAQRTELEQVLPPLRLPGAAEHARE
jgi:catechol 2,3-dioxygenase-like lactoylglutathione lyase family enzyme